MRKQKRQLLKLFNIFITICLLLTLSSCGDSFLSVVYKGYLSDGTELNLSSGQNVELNEYTKFKYTTAENAEIKSETIIEFDFKFYSDSIEEISLLFSWEYTTTIFNIKHSKALGQITFRSNGDIQSPQDLSLELPEENYFVIKNNKTQYLTIEVEAPSGFLCFIDVPEIFSMIDDDEKALEDEFDKEFEDYE